MDWDNIHDISDDVINDDIEEDGDAHWTGRFFKLSKSPIGSFFGNWNCWTTSKSSFEIVTKIYISGSGKFIKSSDKIRNI